MPIKIKISPAITFNAMTGHALKNYPEVPKAKGVVLA